VRVAVAGASGLLGGALVDDLRRDGTEVVRIGRGGDGHRADVVWDPARQQLDPRALEGVDVIVNLAGVVNVTSPNPVTNDEFAHTLARVLHRPAMFTVPAAPLKLFYGADMVDETLLGGQRAVPRRLQQAGFVFELPKLEAALTAELARA
jgi:NAD dependent epimerase/dehydratase family enzyme